MATSKLSVIPWVHTHRLDQGTHTQVGSGGPLYVYVFVCLCVYACVCCVCVRVYAL